MNGKRVLFFVLFLASCSSWFGTKKEIQKEEIALPQIEKPPARELGSLWAENSSWNQPFSSATPRKVGDIIFIRSAKRELASQKKSKKEEPLSLGTVFSVGRITRVVGKGSYEVLYRVKDRKGKSESWKAIVRESDINDHNEVGLVKLFEREVIDDKK